MANLILEGLSPDDHGAIRPILSHLILSAGQPLSRDGVKDTLIYFPVEGLISVRNGFEQLSVETSLVGPEGMVDVRQAPERSVRWTEALVLVAGSAFSLRGADLYRLIETRPTLLAALQAHTRLCLEQSAFATFAAAQCNVDQRLARWLLMAQDRLQRDEFSITHEALATALGVRRPGVTVALHVLEGEHAIVSRRARIAIRDRDRLQSCAGFAHHDVFYPRDITPVAMHAEEPVTSPRGGIDRTAGLRCEATAVRG